MTEKEWNELCDWAENLHSNRIEVERDVDIEAIETKTIYVLSVDSYLGYEIGLTIEEDGTIYSRDWVCIANDCSAKQIKSIIKNLIRKVKK